jgi:hypothetical protein
MITSEFKKNLKVCTAMACAMFAATGSLERASLFAVGYILTVMAINGILMIIKHVNRG